MDESKQIPDKKMKRTLRFWLSAAVIGGAYAALTIALAPISFGPMQVRISEALTVLPFFTPAAVPGLFVGCVISNIITSPYPIDFVVGGLASLLAAFLSYVLRRWIWAVPAPPVIVNAVAIGIMIWALSGAPASSLLGYMGTIGLGQLLSCYVLGMPLLYYLKKHRRIFELGDE